MKRLTGFAVVFLAGLIAVGFAVASANGRWSVHANGSGEVPVRDGQGQGQGIFKLSDDGTSISYKLIASNIDNVFHGAHSHERSNRSEWADIRRLAVSGHCGWRRAGGRSAPATPSGVLVEGVGFTAANLTGPLTGQPLSALIPRGDGERQRLSELPHERRRGRRANAGPGDFPGGEIRGDIE